MAVKKKVPTKIVTRPTSINKSNSIVLPKESDLTRPPEEFTNYTSLIYGAKGVGKTSGCSSFPKNFTALFEPRRRNVSLRAWTFEIENAATITAKKLEDPSYLDAWETMQEVVRLAIDDDSIQTLTIDTVDICYEVCQEHHCYLHGVENPSDKKDFGKCWNEIKFAFTALFTRFINSNKTLVFVSHAKERDQEFQEGTADLSIVGPSCASSALKIMKQMCDFWFYYGYKDGKRTLYVRDPERNVDVSCGIGFQGIDSISIPPDPSKFFDTINKSFKGVSEKKVSSPVRKISSLPKK